MSTSDKVTVTAVRIDREETFPNPTGTKYSNIKLNVTAGVDKFVQGKKDFVKFNKDFFGLIVGGAIVVCCALSYALIFHLAIPIAMIAMGSLYLNECPAEHLIPIYLIVTGILSLVSNYVNHVLCKENGCCKYLLFCWFIAGCVLVYKLHEPSQNPDDSNYCNYTLYTFAFWIVTLPFIELVVLILLFIVFICAQAVAYIPV